MIGLELRQEHDSSLSGVARAYDTEWDQAREMDRVLMENLIFSPKASRHSSEGIGSQLVDFSF